MDSVVDYMIFIPETQEVDGHDEENNVADAIKNTQISWEHHHSSNDNISAISEKFCSSLEATSKRSLKIVDYLIGLSYLNSTTNSNSRDAALDKFYTEFLKD